MLLKKKKKNRCTGRKIPLFFPILFVGLVTRDEYTRFGIYFKANKRNNQCVVYIAMAYLSGGDLFFLSRSFSLGEASVFDNVHSATM